MCLRLLKESNKSKFDSYSAARNSVLIISHNTFRDCHEHIFPDNLSCNSCIYSFSNTPHGGNEKINERMKDGKFSAR